MRRNIVARIFLLLTMLLGGSYQGEAQQPSTLPGGFDETLEAGEAETEEPARRLISWNEYKGKYFSIRVGGGLLYEYAAYAHDDISKRQVELHPEPKLRDARLLLKGSWHFDAPNLHFIWNVGAYTDLLSEGQTFSTYDYQVAGRFAWLPVMSEKAGELLHLGVSSRYGKPNEGQLQQF